MPNTQRMTPNFNIAHYRIVSKIGEGGMGAVYRATDTKLARDVAIKVLPEAFSKDPDRLARFTREAQLLASLNHPNIATIHGIEENAIVMELVEGPTIADRIGRGALPLDEALAVARQIAEALESAHEKGIIHRDLKPANVKITPEGNVKVLDFGLAKLADPGEPADPASTPTVVRGNSPTLAGMIMGTAGYMAPEQARGMPVDKRADIWAFGVVLFEMLTGTQTFEGHTIADQMASVLKSDPDWNALPAETPYAVKKVLRRCLDRDRKRRFHDIGDVRMELEERHPVTAVTPVVDSRRSSSRVWIAATAVASIAAVALGVMQFRRNPPEPQMVRFTIPPPTPDESVRPSTVSRAGSFGSWIGASPDGRFVAFRFDSGDGLRRLWIRPVDSLSPRPLVTLDGEGWGFWSPDSRYIGFQSAGKLRKVEVTGGPPTTLCDLNQVFLGGAWNSEGTILFGSNSAELRRVSSSGGFPTSVTTLVASRQEWKHSDPFFLPDGKHFLYLRSSRNPALSGVFVGSLDDKPEQQNLNLLIATEFSPVYTPAHEGSDFGYLLYLREGTLFAQQFDTRSLTVSGEATPLAEQISTIISRASFSASSNRILAYRQGANSTFAEWMDRSGRPLGNPIPLGNLTSLGLSPDEKHLIYTLTTTTGERQVWLSDLRGRNSRFSFTPDGGGSPVWSPDGSQIAFSSSVGRGANIYRKAANGEGSEVLLFRGPSNPFPLQWSPDGKYLLFATSQTRMELWLLPDPGGPEPAGGRKAIPLLPSPFSVTGGQFSPDSRWIAYASNETGRTEVYVQPFPTSSGEGKWLISSGGGSQPRWRRDGKELFYLSDGQLMAVDIVTKPVFQAMPPKVLFSSFFPISTVQARYEVSADGSRILVASRAGANLSPITVILNWSGLFRK
jgi:eukaryotic-like serine/threonine-protein kinase